ncbi:unnamed protein product [Lymnaea stagnalis]|uniref:G-protein coupled receptors family 1 profile domain-containing protein n=1 Tax=Lymnaea stagnalis TaxID=6523 RepID=A0AAV2HKH9_LYMST
MTTQILIASMAAVGSLYGISVMPMGVLEMIHNGEWPLGERFCRARHACNQFLGINFMIHVMCLSIDRYIAICKPLKYRVLTYRTGLIMTAVTWLLTSLTLVEKQIFLETQVDVIAPHYNASSLIKPDDNILTDKIFVLANYFLWNSPFYVSYLLNGFLLLEVYRYHKRSPRSLKTKKFENSQTRSKDYKSKKNKPADVGQAGSQKPGFCPGDGASCSSVAYDPPAATEDKKQESAQIVAPRRSKMFRAVRTVGFMMICYTLCWLPAWIYMAWLFGQGLSFPLWSEILVLWITYSNSALNPMIYCTYKPVSRAFKSLFET